MVGGVFFAFSSFVIRALAKMPATDPAAVELWEHYLARYLAYCHRWRTHVSTGMYSPGPLPARPATLGKVI